MRTPFIPTQAKLSVVDVMKLGVVGVPAVMACIGTGLGFTLWFGRAMGTRLLLCLPSFVWLRRLDRDKLVLLLWHPHISPTRRHNVLVISLICPYTRMHAFAMARTPAVHLSTATAPLLPPPAQACPTACPH